MVCPLFYGLSPILPYQGFSALPATPAVIREKTKTPTGAALPEEASSSYPAWVSYLTLFGVVALIPLAIIFGTSISPWVVPGLVVLLLGYGWVKKVRVYETFVERAKEGFHEIWGQTRINHDTNRDEALIRV